MAVLGVVLIGIGIKSYIGADSRIPGIAKGKSAAAAFLLGKSDKSPESAPSVPAAAPSSDPVEWHAPIRNYPRPDTFTYQGQSLVADYAPDSLLNARISLYLQRYRPETGVIIAADLRTGHVLGMGERADSLITSAPKLAFAGGFPAASLVKILTATAALESNARELVDSIPQLGGHHTLYRRQLKTEGVRNLTRITLEDAFCKSVNPAFGMLGLSMGAAALRTTALHMGFNKPTLPSYVATSRIAFPDTGFSLAEASCGFTAKTTISPWHALQIARGAGDDGRLRVCGFAHSIVNLSTRAELSLSRDSGNAFVSQDNLPRLQSMMEATVRKGTSRKGFHSIMKANHMDKIVAGGKTGSLDGEEVPGRFDWFVGYVKLKDDTTKGLAISIMLIHREYASIHASQLAALLIRDWLSAYEKARKAEEKARKAELAYKAA